MLIIQAIYRDCVTECGPRLIGWADTKSAFSVLRNWFKLSQQGQGLASSSGHDSMQIKAGSLRAFAETLLGGLVWRQSSHGTAEEADIGPLEDWLRLSLDSEVCSSGLHAGSFETAYTDTTKDPSACPSPFFEAIEVATDGRVFFVTKNGSMGLGPASLLLGDVIYILPSGQTHFALRKRIVGKRFPRADIARGDPRWTVYDPPEWLQNTSTQQHELVGDCYLNRDGMLDAQDEEAAMDGSLPFEFLGASYLNNTSPKVEAIMLI